MKTRKTEEVSGGNWSQAQQKALEAALAKHPKGGAGDRWQKIASSVPGKSKVSAHFYILLFIFIIIFDLFHKLLLGVCLHRRKMDSFFFIITVPGSYFRSSKIYVYIFHQDAIEKKKDIFYILFSNQNQINTNQITTSSEPIYQVV